MPVVQIKMNIDLDREKKQKLLILISHLIADTMKKPISDIMVMHSYNDFFMNESFEHAAYIELKYISGLNISVSRAICEGVLNVLKQIAVQIDPSRVYINFNEVSKACAWRFINGLAVCPENMPG